MYVASKFQILIRYSWVCRNASWGIGDHAPFEGRKKSGRKVNSLDC